MEDIEIKMEDIEKLRINPDKIKQVIIVRKDLNMRKGKLAAQVSHASMVFLLKRIKPLELIESVGNGNAIFAPNEFASFDAVERVWINERMTKVVVSVDSEEELEEIYKKALSLKVRNVHMVVDSGKTEFGGVPTKTCISLGPDFCNNIDKITKDLKLI